jgi:hypothetical protein
MEAQGLVQTFDQQIQMGREHTRTLANQMIEKVLANFDPPPAFQTKFKGAMNEFIKDAQPPWTGKEIVDVWSKYYGASFTDDELDQLLAYYQSPLGKKDVLATREALVSYTAEFQKRYNPIIEKATQHFIARVQAIGAECNCKKIPPTSPL